MTLQKNTMKSLSLALLTAAVVQTTACTTFGHKGPGGDDDGVATASEKSSVIIQAGQKDPVASAHDRSYWLDLRQSKKLLPKLQGALATGEAEAAINLAKAYLAKDPGNVEAMAMLASALALTHHYELAAYYATLIERASPGHPVALNVKGMAAMVKPKARAADFRLAITYFQQAFDAHGGEVAAGLNLGNLYLEIGNPGLAADVFGKVVDRCGHCTAGLMGEGIAASRNRDFPKASTAFNEVLKKNPNHAGALYNLALVQKNGYNNSKEAEKYLFAVLNDSRTKDASIKERAQTVLRMIKGEATAEDRTAVADEESAPEVRDEAGQGDEHDAELLMTGAEAEDK